MGVIKDELAEVGVWLIALAPEEERDVFICYFYNDMNFCDSLAGKGGRIIGYMIQPFYPNQKGSVINFKDFISCEVKPL